MNYMRIYENYGRIDLFRDNHHKQRERERESNELVYSLMIID